MPFTRCRRTLPHAADMRLTSGRACGDAPLPRQLYSACVSRFNANAIDCRGIFDDARALDVATRFISACFSLLYFPRDTRAAQAHAHSFAPPRRAGFYFSPSRKHYFYYAAAAAASCCDISSKNKPAILIFLTRHLCDGLRFTGFNTLSCRALVLYTPTRSNHSRRRVSHESIKHNGFFHYAMPYSAVNPYDAAITISQRQIVKRYAMISISDIDCL